MLSRLKMLYGPNVKELGYGYYWLEDSRNNLLINKDGKVINTRCFYFIFDNIDHKVVRLRNKRTNKTYTFRNVKSREEFISIVFNNAIYYENIMLLVENDEGQGIIMTVNSNAQIVHSGKITEHQIKEMFAKDGLEDGVLNLYVTTIDGIQHNIEILTDGSVII